MTATTTTATTSPGTARRTILKRPHSSRLSKHKAHKKPLPKPPRPLLLSNLRIHYGTRRRPSSDSSCTETGASSTTANEPHTHKVVRFAPKVRIKRVPSRHAYEADNVKTNLWFTKQQLRELVHRNTLQAQYEPADWRDIAEDDEDTDSTEEDDGYLDDESSLEEDS